MTDKMMDEINSLKNTFLVCLNDDEDNDLHIIICGASYERTSDEDKNKLEENFGDEKLVEIIKNCISVIPDHSVVYDIFFERYVGYSVRNESFTVWDDNEKFTGGHFRIYSKSNYLDYIKKSAPVAQAEYTHYGVCCENHIIDVASDKEPIINKITKIQKGDNHA